MLFNIRMREVKHTLFGTQLGLLLDEYQIEAKNWIEASEQADQKYINEHPYDKTEIFSYVV